MQEGDAYLWKEGHKKRYYESKFAVGPDDIDFRTKITTEYVRGLCWVLQYYYQVNQVFIIFLIQLKSSLNSSFFSNQGVPSWRWYFPYHYAPFASDFQCINKVDCIFQKDIPVSGNKLSYLLLTLLFFFILVASHGTAHVCVASLTFFSAFSCP